MLTTPIDNVKFTDEQTLQLQEWQQRLNVLLDEIRVAEKKLADLLQNIDNNAKHNNYLEEQTIHLQKQNDVLLFKQEELNTEISKSNELLNECNKEMREQHNKLSTREEGVRSSESHAHTRHKELDEREVRHSTKEKELAELSLAVEQAQHAFLQASKLITWKSHNQD